MMNLELYEWSKYPLIKELETLSLPGNSQDWDIIEELNSKNILKVVKTSKGFSIETRSWVGLVSIGPLNLTIKPKISEMPLMRLFGYAYGLDNLRLFSKVHSGHEYLSFLDFLVQQFLAQVETLIRKGVHRGYVLQSERLPSPKGKINFTALSRQGHLVTSSIPCDDYHRSADCLENQVLAAGVEHCLGLTKHTFLRAQALTFLRQLEPYVTLFRLDSTIIHKATQKLNRMNQNYQPAFELLELLVEKQGSTYQNNRTLTEIPGFLFDMNRFYQKLLTRLIQEGLPDFHVKSEHVFKEQFSYVPGFNPQNKKSRSPRPDLVIFQSSKIVAILDAKYRDIWEHGLERGMLYQLALYGMSIDQKRATILYPTMNSDAKEARLRYHDSLHQGLVEVIQKPVLLSKLDELLTLNPSAQRTRKIREYVESLVGV